VKCRTMDSNKNILCIIHMPFRKNHFDKDFCHLGCNTVWSIENQPMFWRNMSPLVSGFKSTLGKKPTWSRQAAELGWLSLDYMVLDPRKYNSA
jgi:hypothetical protein